MKFLKISIVLFSLAFLTGCYDSVKKQTVWLDAYHANVETGNYSIALKGAGMPCVLGAISNVVPNSSLSEIESIKNKIKVQEAVNVCLLSASVPVILQESIDGTAILDPVVLSLSEKDVTNIKLDPDFVHEYVQNVLIENDKKNNADIINELTNKYTKLLNKIRNYEKNTDGRQDLLIRISKQFDNEYRLYQEDEILQKEMIVELDTNYSDELFERVTMKQIEMVGRVELINILASDILNIKLDTTENRVNLESLEVIKYKLSLFEK